MQCIPHHCCSARYHRFAQFIFQPGENIHSRHADPTQEDGICIGGVDSARELHGSLACLVIDVYHAVEPAEACHLETMRFQVRLAL